jgi:hypothetical protein
LFAVFPVSSGLLGGFLHLLRASFYESRGYWWINLDYFAMEIGVDSKIWKQHVTSHGIW